MFDFFKKQYPEIENCAKTWTVSKGEYQGNPIFIRYRDGLIPMIGNPKYPYMFSFSLEYEMDDKGMILNDQEAKGPLKDIEDKIETIFNNESEAVFAFVITNGGIRQYGFYASEWKPEFFEEKVEWINKLFPDYTLHFQMGEDPKWKNFKDFSYQ